MNGRCKARDDIVTDLVGGNLIHFPERIGNSFNIAFISTSAFIRNESNI